MKNEDYELNIGYDGIDADYAYEQWQEEQMYSAHYYNQLMSEYNQ